MTMKMTKGEKKALAKCKPVDCLGCKVGEGYCSRPCWPTPADAVRLIDAGYAGKLMLDWWTGGNSVDGGNIEILCPATPGHGGKRAPAVSDGPLGFMDFMFSPRGGPLNQGCIFFTKGKKCSLHAKGLKPTEGRLACCKTDVAHDIDGESLHRIVAKTWNTAEGRATVKRWKELVA